MSDSTVKGDGFSGRQFDRVFAKPVGRIVRAWGVENKRLRQQRASILQELADHGQEEVLLAFKDRRLGWADVLRAKRQNRIASANLAVDLALHRLLWDGRKGRKKVPGALSLTLPKMGKTQSTRDRYESAFKNLREAAGDFLPDDAIVSALGAMTAEHWDAVWSDMQELSPATRNRVRSAVSRFLSLFLADKYHPTRRTVMQRMGSFEKEKRGEPRTITLDEFWRLMEALPPDTREVLEPCYITLAASGMRIGEYLQCGTESLRRFPTIAVPDGKGGARDVAVAVELEDIVRQALPCRIAPAPAEWLNGEENYPGVQFDARYNRLYDALAAASKTTGIAASPHYLRHLFGALAVKTTNQVSAQHALGHETPGMTAHYAKEKTTQAVGAAVGAALLEGRAKVRESVRDTAPPEGN
jgi:integrase